MELGYGAGTIQLDVEGDGRYEVLFPDELSGVEDEIGEVGRALDESIGASLFDIDGCKSASIMVSDITRPAPSSKMLPPLIERLKAIGIEDIKIVFGLGTHRRMTSKEEKTIIQDCTSFPHVQHDKTRCIFLGETKRGTPVEIFEEVAATDLKIGTGNIEYHYYAGYSGGAKAVLPGVSSERSINKNHAMMTDPLARSGSLESPVRLDMEEAAGIVGLDFILNAVLNSRKEIVRAVAGDYVKAHRVGAKVVDQMYKKKVKPAKIVIACAGGRPKDINLYQAHKAMDNAKEAVLPGGTMILLAECAEGLGDAVFSRWAKEAACPEDCVDRFGREYEFGGHKAALIAKESLEKNLILVSKLPREMVEMCFFGHASSLEDALKMAWDQQGEDSKVLVMPYGGLTLATPE